MVEIDSSTPPDIDGTKARRDHLANEWLDAKASIEKHQEVADQIADQIIRELGDDKKHEILPGVGIKIQGPSQLFDAELAKKVLTAEQYAAICEPKPSAKLAAQLLPGVLVDQCRRSGTKTTVRAL